MVWAIGTIVAAGVAVAGLTLWLRASAQLVQMTQRAQSLEDRVAQLEASLVGVRRQLRVLEARTAPTDGPAPRLALEAVTGPVVKAVAFSAGARRAVSRLVRP